MRPPECERCGGTGQQSTAGCPQCDGTGTPIRRRYAGTCGCCHGRGYYATEHGPERCAWCYGSGDEHTCDATLGSACSICGRPAVCHICGVRDCTGCREEPLDLSDVRLAEQARWHTDRIDW